MQNLSKREFCRIIGSFRLEQNFKIIRSNSILKNVCKVQWRKVLIVNFLRLWVRSPRRRNVTWFLDHLKWVWTIYFWIFCGEIHHVVRDPQIQSLFHFWLLKVISTVLSYTTALILHTLNLLLALKETNLDLPKSIRFIRPQSNQKWWLKTKYWKILDWKHYRL